MGDKWSRTEEEAYPPNPEIDSRFIFFGAKKKTIDSPHTDHPWSMRLPVKLRKWKYGLVLVLFVILLSLNVVAVEQDYYKVRRG